MAIEQTVDCGGRQSGFKRWPCHLPGLQPWGKKSASLHLGFLITKMGIKMIPFSQSYWEEQIVHVKVTGMKIGIEKMPNRGSLLKNIGKLISKHGTCCFSLSSSLRYAASPRQR